MIVALVECMECQGDRYLGIHGFNLLSTDYVSGIGRSSKDTESHYVSEDWKIRWPRKPRVFWEHVRWVPIHQALAPCSRDEWWYILD